MACWVQRSIEAMSADVWHQGACSSQAASSATYSMDWLSLFLVWTAQLGVCHTASLAVGPPQFFCSLALSVELLTYILDTTPEQPVIPVQMPEAGSDR